MAKQGKNPSKEGFIEPLRLDFRFKAPSGSLTPKNKDYVASEAVSMMLSGVVQDYLEEHFNIVDCETRFYFNNA